ncbi:MAG: PAS domain-containing protein [Verrucomicrobiota bacterium]
MRCSSSLARKLGLPQAEEAIGKRHADFLAENQARESFEDEQAIVRTGQPLIGKTEKETWPDGSVTWSLTNKMALRNQANEIIGTFGISKDITAIKETEAKLNEAHKQLLETSRQAGMAEVATGVLHNVGNVLNSVNVSSTLVIESLRKSRVHNLAKAVALMHWKPNAPRLRPRTSGESSCRCICRSLAEHLAYSEKAALAELTALQKNIGTSRKSSPCSRATQWKTGSGGDVEGFRPGRGRCA